jgi:hypothetical protein
MDPASAVLPPATPETAPAEPSSEQKAAEAALVKRWWDKTRERPDFLTAVEQVAKDEQTLLGLAPKQDRKDLDDPARSTVAHVFRTGIQTLASMVPPETAVRIEPVKHAQAVPGQVLTPPEREALRAVRSQALGLASVATPVMQRYCEDVALSETIEAFVQDAVHFPMAILKVTWQRDLRMDSVAMGRLNDAQDGLSRALRLTGMLDRGETLEEADQAELKRLLEMTGKSEIPVNAGLQVQLVPLRQFRFDARVEGPEQMRYATWMRHDVLMTMDEVCEKFGLTKEQVSTAGVYSIDATGRYVKRAANERRDTQGSLDGSSLPTGDSRQTGQQDGGGRQLLLVAEIWDAISGKVYQMVEGLDFFANEWEPEDAGDEFFPFIVLVLNRMPGCPYGISDTQLQSKPQAAANRKREGAEAARWAAQPRWVYDADVAQDATEIQKAVTADPGTATGVRMKGKDSKDFLIPIASNHQFEREEHDIAPELDEQRRMSGLPEEGTGGKGTQKFAASVHAAVSASSILMDYRRNRVNRAVRLVYQAILRLCLFHVGQQRAMELAGPLAVTRWPATPPERQQVARSLQVTVKVNVNGDMDREKRIAAFQALFESAKALGIRIPPEAGGRLLAQILGEEELQDLVQTDPDVMVAELASQFQADPQLLTGLPPDLLTVLTMLGQQAMAIAQQQMMQEAAAAGQPGPAAPAQAPAMAGA